jgi:hypothetical protein
VLAEDEQGREGVAERWGVARIGAVALEPRPKYDLVDASGEGNASPNSVSRSRSYAPWAGARKVAKTDETSRTWTPRADSRECAQLGRVLGTIIVERDEGSTGGRRRS